MLITPFEIYLISKANVLLLLSALGFAIVTIFMIVAFVCRNEDKRKHICGYDEARQKADEEEKDTCVKEWDRLLKRLIFFVCLFLGVILCAPSTKTLIAMYTIPPIVNNSEVQKIPENLLNFVNTYLEKK